MTKRKAAEVSPERSSMVPSASPPAGQPDAFSGGYGKIPSGELNYLMRRMMQKGAEEVVATSDNWPSASLAGEGVAAEVLFTPAAQSPIPHMDLPADQAELYRRRMWYLVRGMDDLTADCWDALMAQWVAEAKSPDAKVWVSVDRILQYRGLGYQTGGSRRGGYTAAQRAAVTESLLRIIAMRVQVLNMSALEEQEDGEGGHQVLPVQRQIGGPALEVGLDLTQTDFLGRTEIKALLVKPGEMFARYFMGAGRPVAVLSQKALAYRPDREDWEKRLTRFLAYSWDRQSQDRGVERQRHTVASLLEAAQHSANPTRPDDTKERLEKALHRLTEDQVIAGWEYVQDTWSEANRPSRRWLPIWLTAEIEIVAPEEVTRFYALSLPSEVSGMALAPGLPVQILDGELTGQAIEALRRHFGLSQQEIADQLGVTRSLIALVETGRRPPSAKLQKSVKEWLAKRSTM